MCRLQAISKARAEIFRYQDARARIHYLVRDVAGSFFLARSPVLEHESDKSFVISPVILPIGIPGITTPKHIRKFRTPTHTTEKNDKRKAPAIIPRLE